METKLKGTKKEERNEKEKRRRRGKRMVRLEKGIESFFCITSIIQLQ
jgi:hypothetical protein